VGMWGGGPPAAFRYMEKRTKHFEVNSMQGSVVVVGFSLTIVLWGDRMDGGNHIVL
jgi:hypothetical protein